MQKVYSGQGSKNELSFREACKEYSRYYSRKISTYRFADYKEDVIELLQKVVTVSIERMKAIRQMEKRKE